MQIVLDLLIILVLLICATDIVFGLFFNLFGNGPTPQEKRRYYVVVLVLIIGTAALFVLTRTNPWLTVGVLGTGVIAGFCVPPGRVFPVCLEYGSHSVLGRLGFVFPLATVVLATLLVIT